MFAPPSVGVLLFTLLLIDLVTLLIFGYLIGSISPGYFWGRIIKEIDIRTFGRFNTGATNTYYVVGPIYGVITGVIDFVKTPLVYFVAVSGTLPNLAAVNPNVAILVGLAGVLGHIFPPYLNFRGGRGVASLYGLNFIVLFLFRNFSGYSLLLFIGTVFYSILISQRLEIKDMLKEAPLRKFLKLSGLILPLSYLVVSKSLLVYILGISLVVFLVFDLLRFLLPKLNQRYLSLKMFAKQKELKQFSGYALFFLSNFLLITFFAKEIAILSLVIFIVGDVFAPFGRVFSLKKIIDDKTWGGAATIFFMALVAGLFLKSLALPAVSLKMIAGGALAASFLDQFSFLIDDNILVPFGAAIILTLLV